MAVRGGGWARAERSGDSGGVGDGGRGGKGLRILRREPSPRLPRPLLRRLVSPWLFPPRVASTGVLPLVAGVPGPSAQRRSISAMRSARVRERHCSLTSAALISAMLRSVVGARLSGDGVGVTRLRQVRRCRFPSDADELLSLFMASKMRAKAPSRTRNATKTERPTTNSWATAGHDSMNVRRVSVNTSAKKLSTAKDMSEQMVKSRCGRSLYTPVTSEDTCPARALTGGYPMVRPKVMASVGSFAPLEEAIFQPSGVSLRIWSSAANRYELWKTRVYPSATRRII